MVKPSTSGAKPRSTNAVPLESDLPGKGNKRLESENKEAAVGIASAKKQRKQSNAALENVKNGY